VRSVLEYAAPIWDPNLAKDTQKLESIQRRAARFIKGDYHTSTSVTQMLHELGLKNLQDRRRDLRLALLFKLVHGQVEVRTGDIGLVEADGRTRANHKYKFRAIGAHTSAFKYSFAVRTVADWNRLPANIVEQDSVDAFKAGLGLVGTAAPHAP
jgi:hypothetical protein